MVVLQQSEQRQTSPQIFFFPKIWEHILSGTTLHGCF